MRESVQALQAEQLLGPQQRDAPGAERQEVGAEPA